MTVQGWIEQGAARRAARGIVVLAGAGNGVLPSGFSNVTGSISVPNGGSGNGVLVPGAATFELQLTMGGTLVEARTIPVTLTAWRPPRRGTGRAPRAPFHARGAR